MINLIIINSISIIILAIALIIHIINEKHKEYTFSLKDLQLNNEIQKWYQKQRDERDKR